ncbi:hypothetical protein C2E25_00065 [Geothermobacter hydrogeniphilus]|uniref:Lipoprotein n=1 Tax=Geothermobacter hydrogeniphilus TaxID=1969733 RepID=A0A2K2HED8_9BACT|nr:hypothetical protein [Geothermobacter hydrogeniphilus]PNU21662.1 hypothetical protein C2E25_00065 [Geothermobacter hydrogeniphilus]
MRFAAGVLLLCLMLLGGCVDSGRWVWHQVPGGEPGRDLRSDLYACEDYADEVSTNGPPDEVVFAREFGGWGNTDVERCMAERQWRLTLDRQE